MAEINIRLDTDKADALSCQLSDWLCWVGGVQWATRNDDFAGFIPDIDWLRKLNIEIKNELRKEKE